jgi:hypothetical protein
MEGAVKRNTSPSTGEPNNFIVRTASPTAVKSNRALPLER